MDAIACKDASSYCIKNLARLLNWMLDLCQIYQLVKPILALKAASVNDDVIMFIL